MFFRWKAVVDSVQFRVILNITTKRFDVASWHAEMLRFGRRPTAATMPLPGTTLPVKRQIRRGRSPAGFAKSKIIFLLFMPRATRRAF